MTGKLVNIRPFLILAIFSLFLIVFDLLGWLNIPKSLIQEITLPIQYGFYKTGTQVSQQFKFIFMARYAAQENLALRTQLGELISENATLRKKLTETESLVDQQNSLNPKTYNLLPARPIGLGRYLSLDKGSDDGVVLNQVVVFKDNYLGSIKNITPKISQVQLMLDPDSKIAVFSQGESGKAKGVLQGQFGQQTLMDKILHAENITEGDLVYSAGTEGLLPRGLVMGRVTLVMERQNEVFKQAIVKPVFDITDLELVFIIKDQ